MYTVKTSGHGYKTLITFFQVLEIDGRINYQQADSWTKRQRAKRTNELCNDHVSINLYLQNIHTKNVQNMISQSVTESDSQSLVHLVS